MKHLAKVIEIAYNAGVNVLAHGTHGIGKTAVTESLRSCGFYVKVIILSQSDPLVLGGYPGRETIGTDENDNPVFATTFAKPQWIIDCEAAKERGEKTIVFLDEFNRADRYALAAAMRLVNEGEISGHKVPEGTIFVGACNPETENDSDLAFLNDPTIDRWCHVPVYVDTKAWLSWSKDAGVNEFVQGFIHTDDGFLNTFNMEGLFENQILKRVKPTPRSNDAVSRILNTYCSDGEQLNLKKLNQTETMLMIRGLCGTEYASAFNAYCSENYAQPFTVKEMLSGKKSVLKKANSLREKGNTQVLIASLETAHAEIPKLKDVKLDGFWEFLLCAPVDVQNAFWYNKDEEVVYWSMLLAGSEVPMDVLAALNKD